MYENLCLMYEQNFRILIAVDKIFHNGLDDLSFSSKMQENKKNQPE